MSTHRHYTGENLTVLEHAKRKSENTPSRRKIWPCELSFAADCMLPVIYCRAVFSSFRNPTSFPSLPSLDITSYNMNRILSLQI